MIRIPDQTKKWIQTNKGNIFGNLWATFNIDLFGNPGAIRVGNRMKVITKTGDTNAANLGVPVGFTYFKERIFCMAGSRIFRTQANDNVASTTFQEDTSTGAQTDYNSASGDLINFNSVLVSSDDTAIWSLSDSNGGTWTSRGSGLGSGQNHMFAYFPKFKRLYVTDSADIQSFDQSWNRAALTDPYSISFANADNFPGFVTCIVPGSDRMWIGFKKQISGAGEAGNPVNESSVAEWDGSSGLVTKEYKIPAQGVMAMTIQNDIPIIMDSNGVLRKFDNSGFKEIGRLPLHRGDSLVVNNVLNTNFIHPKGLTISKDGTVLALIRNDNAYLDGTTQSSIENLPSGIWEFDQLGNANHRSPLTYMGVTSTSVTDHGQNRISQVGSLANMKVVTASAYGITTLMAGAEYFTDATTKTKAIFIDAPTPTNNASAPEGQKAGYIVTTWIESQNIEDTWQKVYPTYRKFLDSGDKIVVKCRTAHSTATIATITWTSTTTFTTTTDLSALTGYEVEVIQGIGSGKCSHILTVVNNSGTYTVTVDETYTGASSTTAIARVQNWTKVTPAITQDGSDFKRLSIERTSSKIQLKVWMQFKGDGELYGLLLTNISPALAVQLSS